MTLLEKAERLRQNLSLVGLLDIIIEICKEIEEPEMLVDPNVSMATNDVVTVKRKKKK